MKTIKYVSLALVLLGVQAMFGVYSISLPVAYKMHDRGCFDMKYEVKCNDKSQAYFLSLRNDSCDFIAITDLKGNKILNLQGELDAHYAAEMVCGEREKTTNPVLDVDNGKGGKDWTKCPSTPPCKDCTYKFTCQNNGATKSFSVKRADDGNGGCNVNSIVNPNKLDKYGQPEHIVDLPSPDFGRDWAWGQDAAERICGK